MKQIKLVAAALLAASATSASAAIVTFAPGAYELADSKGDAPVDTLAVSVSGGVASFVLSGADNETFSVPDMSTPSGIVLGDAPYYDSASLPSVSYSATDYPYLTFYHESQGGGLTIGLHPADSGPNLVNLFYSDEGTGQVFTITGVPEPATWLMLLTGVAAVGCGLRRRVWASTSTV